VITNDGDFAQRMAHPSFEVEKTYVAEVEGEVFRRTVKQLLKGVVVEDRAVDVRRARVVEATPQRSIVELTIHEGRNRIVRKLLAEVGHPVRRLTRTAIGPIRLGRLASGAIRELSPAELGELLDAARL
jgi:23S rRNA pseudouridine2605 synthase